MPTRVMPSAGLYCVLLNPAMEQYGITTYLREAAFLATVAHESGEFKFLDEIWGPTPAQEGYEGRADLGNIKPGDGFKFRGRGAIQITGRSNYIEAGTALGLDLVMTPELLQSPVWAVTSACWWWQKHGCNELADIPDFKKVTRRVNGGLNGYADREKYYDRALATLKPADFSNVESGVVSV